MLLLRMFSTKLICTLHNILIMVDLNETLKVYHGVLILCEFFVSNSFPRNIFHVKHFLTSLFPLFSGYLPCH